MGPVGRRSVGMAVPAKRHSGVLISANVKNMPTRTASSRTLYGEQIRSLALPPNGLLCLASLTHGALPFECLVSSGLERVYALRPGLVGGGRPIELQGYLPPEHWQIAHRNVLSRLAISSEVVVASAVAPA